ncbi:MAG: hypothetical protein H6Q20_541 [Bacteroidetes bacterium]|nr:hypothetical protein [Bacteroidota bacterium]
MLIYPVHYTAGQNPNTQPERTPELEAARQTEKLQEELNLSPEQAKQINEINLKYARARQNSNSRSEAMQRIKDKDNELKRVLNNDQYTRLQNKRYERSSFRSSDVNTVTPQGSRANTDSRVLPQSQNFRQSDNSSNASRDARNYNQQPSTRTRSDRQYQTGAPTISRNPYQPSYSAPRASGSSGRESSTTERTRSANDNSGSRSASGSRSTSTQPSQSTRQSSGNNESSRSSSRSSSGSNERTSSSERSGNTSGSGRR